MILLIGYANVSNFLLASGAVRHRDIAIRMAIGARRGRLIRQMLAENLPLSFISATLSVLVVARWQSRGTEELAAVRRLNNASTRISCNRQPLCTDTSSARSRKCPSGSFHRDLL